MKVSRINDLNDMIILKRINASFLINFSLDTFWITIYNFKCYCDGKFFKIPKRDFTFARVKTG